MVPLRPIDLQSHCSRMSATLNELCVHDPITYENEGEYLEFSDAAELLDIAAGISKVDLLTNRFDDALAYCESAMEYENARSVLISRFVTQMTIFLFSWGAFETTAKIINPASIPANQRVNGANSPIDKVIYYIKSAKPPYYYQGVVEHLEDFLFHHPQYTKKIRKSVSFYSNVSGKGLAIIRDIRNKFAHGIISFPIPGEDSGSWNGLSSNEPIVFELSTRIVLFSIQMMLAIYYQNSHFKISILQDEDGLQEEKEVLYVLENLHVQE